jgi:hypothetical protein
MSYITTRTSLISTCRVWFIHAEYDYDTHECDFDTHKFDYGTNECNNFMKSVITTRRVKLLQEECDFYTQSVIFTCNMWFLNAEWDFNTLNMISTNMSVILTRMRFITTRTIVTSARRVWFLPAECNFDTHECDLYTLSLIFIHMSVCECDFCKQSVISTLSVWFPRA